MTTRGKLNQSSPMAQIARFDDWRDIDFEMAYIPAKNDYLKWSLGPKYKAPPHSVPYSYPNGNGIDGRLYGTNNIPVRPMFHCDPFVNPCCEKTPRGYSGTRARDQGPLTR